MVPSKVIQSLQEEGFQNIDCLGTSFSQLKLREELNQLNIPKEKIEDILRDFKESDIFLKCNGGPLRSILSRDRFYRKHFKFVEAQTHHLGKNSKKKKKRSNISVYTIIRNT